MTLGDILALMKLHRYRTICGTSSAFASFCAVARRRPAWLSRASHQSVTADPIVTQARLASVNIQLPDLDSVGCDCHRGFSGLWRTQVDAGLLHERLDSFRREAPEEVDQQVLLPGLAEDHSIYCE